MNNYWQGRQEGDRGGGGNWLGLQTSRGLQLEKYPRIEQGLTKFGGSTRQLKAALKGLKGPLDVFSTLWNTVNRFLVLLFENNYVIGVPNKIRLP